MSSHPKQKTYDVIIAGAGPVGLFLACELRESGVKVLVLEASKNEPSPLKAAPFGVRGLSTATVETLYRRGLLEDLRAAESAETVGSAPSPKRVRGGHFAGISLDYDLVAESKWTYRVSDTSFALTGPSMSVTMAGLEAVLATRAARLGAEIRYEFPVRALTQDAEKVLVETEHETFESSYLVGCDGGRSQIRRAADFEFIGTEAQFTVYMGLVTIADPEKLKAGRTFTPQGFYMQPQPGFISVMEFDGGAFDRKRAITREHFEAVLRRVSGTDVIVSDLKLATSYTDRAKRTTTLRRGRVLLAGDAAHIHSPLGGQGLNVGIGDAINLGWKLAAAIKQPNFNSLLDSYHDERAPIAEWVLSWSRAQVALMKPDPHSSALRSLVTDLAQTADGATYFVDKLGSLAARYELGSRHPLVGRSVPDFKLPDGSRIGTLFREGRGLLINFGEPSSVRSSESLKSLGVTAVDAGLEDPFDLGRVLVRPDGIVCWVETDNTGDTFERALNRWFGRVDQR